MASLVSPEVYFIGATEMYVPEVLRYLERTGQVEFLKDLDDALAAGTPSGLVMCSLYAKLCYKTLVPGKNANVTKTRSVRANLEGTFDQGHGSVFEHCQLNFLVTNCSRVYTHEQVRQRAGWAYSQTSGRYCRLEDIELVWDPILDPVKNIFLRCVEEVEEAVYLAECALGLRKAPPDEPLVPPETYILAKAQRKDPATFDLVKWVPDLSFDMEKRKKITSAIRRIAPNGQANEMGMSCNLRALRHVVQLRTARHAEREIRDIFNQVYGLARGRWPLIFYRARTRVHDDLLEVYGMKQQPYDLEYGDPAALEHWETKDLIAEVQKRQAASGTVLSF